MHGKLRRRHCDLVETRLVHLVFLFGPVACTARLRIDSISLPPTLHPRSVKHFFKAARVLGHFFIFVHGLISLFNYFCGNMLTLHSCCPLGLLVFGELCCVKLVQVHTHVFHNSVEQVMTLL